MWLRGQSLALYFAGASQEVEALKEAGELRPPGGVRARPVGRPEPEELSPIQPTTPTSGMGMSAALSPGVRLEN